MNILTPFGYKDISEVNIGDKVIGKDGVENTLLGKTHLDFNHYKGTDSLKDYKFYLVNGRKFFRNQSIYCNGNVSHIYLLQKGDAINYQGQEEMVAHLIESEFDDSEGWWRLEVSGDHSYISDGVLLHNASRFLVGGGTGNWNSNTNWSATDGGASGASFPVNGDAVQFNTNSGATNITVNVASACTSLVCSATYTGTLTFNATLTVAGTVTFIAGMSIAGTSDLICTAVATLTSGGLTLTGGLRLTGAVTYTMSGTWTINGTLTLGNSSTGNTTINLSTINVGGGLSVTTTTGIISGSTAIVLNGTGSWSCPNFTVNGSIISMDLTINTAGTITISGSVAYGSGATARTLTYTSGTMVTTGSSLYWAGVAVLNTSGMNWQNVINYSGQAAGVTLSSDLNVLGNFDFGLSGSALTTNIVTNGSFNINVGGHLTIYKSTGIVSGAATIIMNGTGTLSMPSVTSGSLRSNLTFNTSGTITISGTILYNTGTITYTAGTMAFSSSNVTLSAATTLATNGMTWENLTLGNATYTLSNNCQATTINLTTSGTTTINSNTISTTNLSSLTATLAGSSNVTVTGGTVSGTSIAVNKTNNITFAGSITWTVTTFTHTASGSFTTTGSTLTMNGNRTFAGAVTWNNWTTSGTGTLTTNALQTLAGTLTVGDGFTTTFAGSNGVVSCANLTLGASSTLVIPTNATVTSTTTINASGSVINGAFTLNTGGLTMSGNLTGTLSLINFNATGTWSGSGVVIHNTTVNTAGTLTISGIVHYKTGTFTYTAGTVTVTSSTLSIDGSCTFAGALTWNHWTVSVASTVTINALQTLNGTMTLQGATTFSGTNGWTANSFVCTTAGLTHTFKQAITYTVTGTMAMVGTPKNKIKFISASTPTKAILTFTNPQTVYYVSPTDIDSSAGNPVLTIGGVITNTLNWSQVLYPTIVTITG